LLVKESAVLSRLAAKDDHQGLAALLGLGLGGVEAGEPAAAAGLALLRRRRPAAQQQRPDDTVQHPRSHESLSRPLPVNSCRPSAAPALSLPEHAVAPRRAISLRRGCRLSARVKS